MANRRVSTRALTWLAAFSVPWLSGLPAWAASASAPTLPPLLSLSAQPDPAQLGGPTTLIFTIENANATSTANSLTGVGFTDSLPAGLTYVAGSLSTSCGQFSATASANSVTIGGINLGPDTTCVVGIDVLTSSAGTKTDSVTITSDQGTGNTATLKLEVLAPLTFTESFGATWIQPGRPTDLRFKIANANDTPRTAVSFSDPLPGGLRVAKSSHLSNSCGSGHFIAAPGSASVKFSGATIRPGQSCALSVTVASSVIGAKHNTTGPITSHEDGADGTASATLSIAKAGDRVLWTNTFFTLARKMSFADLTTGAGAGDLVPDNAGWTVTGGLAIDVAAGRVYYADSASASLPYARLDGTGAGRLTHSTVSASFATGIAIDPATKRIYWANSSSDTISYTGLNGKGGGVLNTVGATVNYPVGVAIDPSHNRIYWANGLGNSISFTNLDGTGHGGDLSTSGATLFVPEGVAIDPLTRRIYWANYQVGVISYANLDGSGGGDLPTPGAIVDRPAGVAIDPDAGLIYWANTAGSIEFASLDGSGGGAVDTSGASVFDPRFVALLKVPLARRIPGITGGSHAGTVLRCSTGTWAGDVPGAFFYQAPQRLAYRWVLGGRTVGTSQRLTAKKAGSYQCVVTASNGAGSAKQTSKPHVVKS